MSTAPREAQIRRWRELGPEGRLKLGASLISLGQSIGPSGEDEDQDEDAAGTE